MNSNTKTSAMGPHRYAAWLRLAVFCSAAALLAGTSEAAGPLVPYRAYLDLPTPTQWKAHAYHQEVKRALLRLDVGPTDGSGDSFLRLLQNGLANNTKLVTSHNHLQVYRELLELANCQDYCSSELIGLVHSLIAWRDYDTKSMPQEIINYVRQFGPHKFARCARADEAGLMSQQVGISLANMTQVFSKALDVERCRGATIYCRLRDFDMAKDAFNAKEMVRTIRALSHPSRSDFSKSSPELVDEFMRAECRKVADLLPPRARVYQVINLSRFLTGFNRHDRRLLLENEFYRLCKDWAQRERRTAIVQNVKARLADTSWFNFGCRDWRVYRGC